MSVPTARALAIGLTAGIVGGLFGVGGGIIVVPGLVLWLGFTQHRASGTSVATIIASAGAALIAFALDGSVDWSAAPAITLGAIFGAALGARLLHRIPARNLTRAFSLLLFVAALRMILA
ncbi:MAG: sulfite exporter TauE/SafE family protein [Acidimicrobiia bacterium]|nr:sulfite exporter TauE/SafE family protein [Acidimicrobiia bacterium]